MLKAVPLLVILAVALSSLAIAGDIDAELLRSGRDTGAPPLGRGPSAGTPSEYPGYPRTEGVHGEYYYIDPWVYRLHGRWHEQNHDPACASEMCEGAPNTFEAWKRCNHACGIFSLEQGD